MGIQDANGPTQLFRHDPDRLREVGVVGDQNRYLESLPERIGDKMRREIHVRPLLLGLDHQLVSLRPGGTVGDGHPDLVREEMSVDDLEIRKCLKGSKVGLLTVRLIRVGRTARDSRREVLDPHDVMPRQELAADRGNIEPLVWSPGDGAVIEVETVDVHDSLHAETGDSEAVEKAEAGLAARPRCPAPEGTRGIVQEI